MSDDRRIFKIEKVDNVTARILTNHPTIMSDVYKYFGVFIDKYWFHPKVKLGIWDGKIHFVNKDGTFPIGLLKYVYKFVKRDDLRVLIDKDLKLKNEEVEEDFAEVTEDWIGEGWVPRPHQAAGAKAALKHRRCIIEHATSSGKSLTMAMIIMYSLMKEQASKALVLVPNLSLIEQLEADFLDYGVPPEWIGKFSGKVKDIDEPIIISTWQSMHKQKAFIRQFDLLLADETHGLKGDVVRSVADNAINCPIRIGCTGTMPEDKLGHWQVEGALGPIVHRMTARELIDQGHASDLRIKICYINYPEAITKELKGSTYQMEKEWLESYQPRNNVIKYLCNSHMKRDENMLILVNKIAHAETLHEQLTKLKTAEHVFIAHGGIDPEERERIRQFTNDNKRVIIVATSGVFSTGISIKRLHGIIFAAAGKSKIRTLQSVGRGLRMHKEKTILDLYDIGDSLKYSDDHLEKRLEFYAKSEFEIDVKEVNL